MEQHARAVPDMAADAALVARAAVRQTVKNHLIVRALRDREDFDATWFASAVRHEFEQLALQNSAEAARLDSVIARTRRKRGSATHPLDYRAEDRQRLELRRLVLLELARELRSLARDEDVALQIVTEARQQALKEISAAAAPVRVAHPLTEMERMLALAALAEDLDNLGVQRRRLD